MDPGQGIGECPQGRKGVRLFSRFALEIKCLFIHTLDSVACTRVSFSGSMEDST